MAGLDFYFNAKNIFETWCIFEIVEFFLPVLKFILYCLF